MKPTAAKQVIALALFAALAAPLAANARPPQGHRPRPQEVRHCRPHHHRPQASVVFCAPPPPPCWGWYPPPPPPPPPPVVYYPPPPPPPPPVYCYPYRPGFNIVFSF